MGNFLARGMLAPMMGERCATRVWLGRGARRAVLVLGLAAGIGARAGDASAKGAGRLAWAGLSRGPLAPAKAELLEGLVLDELDGYDSFRVVDAGGNGLDERLFAAEAVRMSKLVDEGVDHLLNFRHKKAIQRFDQAIEVFESRLTPLRDHELLHEAMLAKAEALFAVNRAPAAEEVLKNLAALAPKKVPTAKTHPPKFVALWEHALSEVKTPGRLVVKASEPACTIILDGKPIGRAPAEVASLAPGKHYVVARWPFFLAAQTVQVAPGRELQVELDRAGPADSARAAVMEALERRSGPEVAAGLTKKVADLAAADDVLIAAVRSDEGALQLYVSRHDAEGRTKALVRAPIAEDVSSESVSVMVRRLSAALFVDKREGEVELVASGEARGASGLAWLLWGRSSGVGAPPAELAATNTKTDALPGLADPQAAGAAEASNAALIGAEPAAPAADGDSVTGAWWFWALLGVAAAGVVAGGALMLRPAPSTTRIEVELPPGGGS